MRILRPRPSTLVCLSLVEVRLGGGFLLDASEAAQIWRPDEILLERFDDDVFSCCSSCCCWSALVVIGLIAREEGW